MKFLRRFLLQTSQNNKKGLENHAMLFHLPFHFINYSSFNFCTIKIVYVAADEKWCSSETCLAMKNANQKLIEVCFSKCYFSLLRIFYKIKNIKQVGYQISILKKKKERN